MKNIAVVLSGCGYLDGAEITESVSTLIHLSQAGVQYRVFAPDVPLKVVNHNTTESVDRERNALVESARISRGGVKAVSELQEKSFDAIVFPGGFGAAKNLSNFAEKGAECRVIKEVERVIQDFYKAQKPIGAICISPAVVARVLGDKGITVTIGDDSDTAAEIEKMGAKHETCAVDDYITDRPHRIITTPAYMYEAKPHEVFKGVQGLVKELVEMA